MHNNDYYEQALEQARQVAEQRGTEYGNAFEGFEETAATAGVSVETVLRVMVAVKMTRFGRSGNLQDTLLDLANYALLYYGWLLSEEDRQDKLLKEMRK